MLACTYVSNNKNRIATIAETGNFTRGFKTTVTGAATYGFDLNGNMARDPHKKMTVSYFYHNLPKKVTFDNGNIIEWVYDATGNKLTKKTNAATNNVTHYINGIEYVGTVAGYNIEAIYHAEGRCTPQSSTWRYEYSLRDHLGNTRITFTDLNSDGTITASEILQQNHYYPFGGNIEGLTSAGTPNKYQYNGKEWNADFGLEWNDYGARAYDPWVGRWWSVDPMAEKYCRWSSYNYGVDNPVRFIDPDGKSATDYVYLNMQGKEIGRLKSNKVQRVTIIKDENVGAFQALPRSYSSVSKYQSLGISYDTKSQWFVKESAFGGLVI